MLDFVNNHYEVTEENIELLKYLIKAEDIRDYSGSKIDVDKFVTIGRVLGNIANQNPKCTGYWWEKDIMNSFDLKKVTTKVPNQLMIIE